MGEFTCKDCGEVFTIPAKILDRYDNWTPTTCLKCRNAKSTKSPSPKKSSSGSTKSRTARSSLTLREVLDEFDGGPDTGVFTDGSSIPNPGPGGWGAVYVNAGEIVAEDHGHDPHTTNNRMELLALIHGIGLIPPQTPATLYSDSNLAIQTINTWAAGWERNGWRKKNKDEVKNLELVKKLYGLAKSRPELSFQWIKAHDGSLWNEYADALSTAWNRSEL